MFKADQEALTLLSTLVSTDSTVKHLAMLASTQKAVVCVSSKTLQDVIELLVTQKQYITSLEAERAMTQRIFRALDKVTKDL